MCIIVQLHYLLRVCGVFKDGATGVVDDVFVTRTLYDAVAAHANQFHYIPQLCRPITGSELATLPDEFHDDVRVVV
jgi:hypothetical protein